MPTNIMYLLNFNVWVLTYVRQWLYRFLNLFVVRCHNICFVRRLVIFPIRICDDFNEIISYCRRTRSTRCLGLFWRIQSHKHRGVVSRGATDTVHIHSASRRWSKIRVPGHDNQPGTHVRHIHNDESRLRRPNRTARQSEVDVSRHIHDGARQQADRRNNVVRGGFQRDAESGQQGVRSVSVVPTAT